MRRLANILAALSLFAVPIAYGGTCAVETAFAANSESTANLDENGHTKNEENKSATDKARENSKYYVFDVESIFDSSGNGGGLWDGIINAMKMLVTGIALPLAILFVTWRTAYIAVVVYIAHIDPLHMVYSANGSINSRYAGDESTQAWNRRNGVFDWGSMDTFTKAPTAAEQQRGRDADNILRKYQHAQDWAVAWNSTAKRALLIELKHMGIGLFVVFAVWSLINLMIWGATVALNFAGATGGDVMTTGSVLQGFQLLL